MSIILDGMTQWCAVSHEKPAMEQYGYTTSCYLNTRKKTKWNAGSDRAGGTSAEEMDIILIY